jgi:hypothetical protein
MKRKTGRYLAATIAIVAGLSMAVPAIGATGPGTIRITSPVRDQTVKGTVPIQWSFKSGDYVKTTSRVIAEISPNGFTWTVLASNVRITAGGVNWNTTVWPSQAYAIRVGVVGTTIKAIQSPVLVDNIQPDVRITNPTQGSVIIEDQPTATPGVIVGTATVRAVATDNMTKANAMRVAWFLDSTDADAKLPDSVPCADAVSACLTYNFGSDPGQHTLIAVATDIAGNTSQTSIEILSVPGPSTLAEGGVPSPDPSSLPPVPEPDPSSLPPVPSPDPTALPPVPSPDPSSLPPVPTPEETETPDPSPVTDLIPAL